MWRRSARNTEPHGAPTSGGTAQTFRKGAASRPTEGVVPRPPGWPISLRQASCEGNPADEPDGRGRTRSTDRETQERGNPTKRLEFLSRLVMAAHEDD